jgi:asparagine synthetase B (glutamine-hydrolysing)
MCGIWARIHGTVTGGPSCECEEFAYDEEINFRGPDSYHKENISEVEMIGCVLHIRGLNIVKQPIGKDSFWLLWNGEVYGNNVFSDVKYDLDSNDTSQIYQKLQSFSPLQVFSEIEGCFAFILLKDNEIWFGRDFLGRRSLVVSRSLSSYTISSLGPGSQVPTGGIFKIRLSDKNCEFIPWPLPGLCTPSSLRFNSLARDLDFPAALAKSVESRLVGSKDIGILFSGGLDCTILAALAHQNLLPGLSIYLLNVSFQTDAPDRLTSINSYKELSSLYENRDFILVLIDVNDSEIQLHRQRIIKLIGDNDSRMDFSIATALYFASRGQGLVHGTQELVKFKGKVLLSGMGADEIFGGYSRYRSSYQHYGEPGVQREISLDIDRLWFRNLGRDDRVTACHGKELRFPYLDTHLWQSLSSIPLTQVTEPQIPGRDKILLREFAITLGLKEVASFKKRAIQFGTRISQLCNVKDFGSNRKAKGWQSITKDKDLQIRQEIFWCCKKLNEQILVSDDETQIKLADVVCKLSSEKVKIKDKRHLMRVYLGDYLSSLNLDEQQ